MVSVYMRYTYKWLLRVNAHPCVLARESQAPMGAYLGDYGTHMHHCTHVAKSLCSLYVIAIQLLKLYYVNAGH